MEKGNFKVIEPVGIFDRARASTVRQDINDSLDTDVEVILIDFSGVTFTDSSGLGELVRSYKRIREAGKQLYLCSLNDQTKMLFQITNVDRVFNVYETRADFEKAHA
ncbi:STAS domain-containing protein [Trichothermofontia sp.]